MSEIRVKYVNLPLQYKRIKLEIDEAIKNVLEQGIFILGPEVKEFEDRFAKYCESKYALGVANGTDALFLVMKALGIGKDDEVITVPNSFISTTASIANVGAKPVFVDVRDDYNINPELIESAVTSHTKAILPVHLTGRPAEMNSILKIAREHNLYVIEDVAQAVGAKYYGEKVGSFGTAGCFSLHPLKNLNAYGDGGVITTNDIELYDKLIKLHNHGLRSRDECEFWGYNSRLDSIQAAIVNVKLNHLDEWTKKVREIASFYQKHLSGVVKVPVDRDYEESVYHTFIIQCDKRDELQKYLLKKGIETKIHYPIPIHLQESAKHLGYRKGDFPVAESQAKRILSLPIYPELTNEQMEMVVNEVKNFYQ
ncbi:MAG: DegT/DnrJ/EryC1/StrS family aminotransferase [Nanoarchaeota archaeon]|nr:DegT/DnrJ/EryC1/StrS family aminotransferase [Nanoarchaeota archaeon]